MAEGCSKTIPFLPIDREFAANRDAYLEIVERTFAEGWLLQGPETETLERNVARFCQRRHAVAVGSCTDALFFALDAAGVRPGDDVLVTDFSFIATASAILRVGARPVFVDIGQDRHMDLDDAKRRLTAQSRAMICTHLYGEMNSPSRTKSFCDDHGLLLIEDAAQSFGARREGRIAGSLGIAGCLSFDPTKVIGAAGNGGMVLTDDADVARRVRQIHYHGKSAAGSFEELGYNSQLPSLSAALLNYKLQLNAKWLSRRREIAEHYDRHLPSELARPPGGRDTDAVLHKYVVGCSDRDGLLHHLIGNGIQCRIDFARPLHTEPIFRPFVHGAIFPRATDCSRHVISLPIHPFLRDDELQRIVEETKRFFATRSRMAA